ncbi:hypothetical protein GGS24DRAFT_510585 [Hypoxylon argillaceum]|nr:hypothetical protein GGS24DRAFT_510585 [Hypoxylon argillaceum]
MDNKQDFSPIRTTEHNIIPGLAYDFQARLDATKKKHERNNSQRQKKRHSNKHVDDAGLFSCMHKKPVSSIINDYKYLYTLPIFWTHRHEKVLHVLWQSLQPPSCPLPPCQLPLNYLQSPSPGCRKQQIQQETLQTFLRDDWKNPRFIAWWRRQYRLLLPPSYLRSSSRLTRPHLPLLPFSFELIKEDDRFISRTISDLRREFSLAPCNKQRDAIKIMLSGVDPFDTLKILNCLSPSQRFLRVEMERLEIMCGQRGFEFLPAVPIYRLGTILQTCNGKISGHHQGSTVSKAESFWRMAHIDYAHISKGMDMFNNYKRNFIVYGIREGMTTSECMDRYEYEYGDGNWNHPHFIPGIFIAMAQRHRQKKWVGQERTFGGNEVRNVPANYIAPTWQILLTDGPNDDMYAHLYTTQVPTFLVTCFEKPGQWHPPPSPANVRNNARADYENEDARGDASFDFLIRHTRISYDPETTFRERLREAIVFSRDSFQ